ncbi:MAG TPA: VOC family protein [Candidatus Faecimonas gallistercoris]|nr:VOC family protein [Candidatus Faecimonas gallistercoris]
MKFNKLIPELSVSDIHKSKEFYLSIGFSIVYERVEDKFCFLELDGNQLMIEEVNDHWNTGELEYPYGRGINISMEVSDIDKMYKLVQENHYPIFRDMQIDEYRVDDKVYSDKQFLIQDLDGYLLRFTN